MKFDVDEEKEASYFWGSSRVAELN